GGRCVAAIKRTGAPGDFRSNLHRGGTAEKIRLTPEERSIAVRAARTVGLNVSGVDLLQSNHGPVVMEVNSSPGLEGVEGATGVDVAGKIIEFLENHARPNKTRDRRKVRARSPRKEPITIGGVTVAAGTRRDVELPVARLPPDTSLSLPVAVLNGL